MRKSELVNGRKAETTETSKTSEILDLWNKDMSVSEIVADFKSRGIEIRYQMVYGTLVRKGEIIPEKK